MIRGSILLILCVLVAPALIGCGEGNIQQRTYPVTGDVKLDGKPLRGSTVVFHAVDKSKFKWQELPQSITDANGKYSLFTYSANDGAPAADYKVGIAILQAPEEEGGDQVKRGIGSPKLPIKFADANTSGITATVNAKATVIPTIELSSK